MIQSFEEGKCYVVTGKGDKWSDYDGPFDLFEGIDFLKRLGGESHASPELRTAALCLFESGQIGLAKDDSGRPITGDLLYESEFVYCNGEIWTKER